MRGDGEGEKSCEVVGPLFPDSGGGARDVLLDIAVGRSPAKKPTTASIPSLTLNRFSLFSPSPDLERSVSGVNIRVSLYPASFKRSSRHSYVFELPRRCRGTRPRSG